MYSHSLTRLAYLPIFLILFVSGLCTGSLISLLLALMDHSIGFFAGAFLAVLFALVSSLIGLIHTAVFNILAPSLGGITLNVEATPTAPPDTRVIEPPDLPSY